VRGRKPKPVALKLLQGNPGRRPLNLDEVRPPVGCEKPDWLPPSASAVWDEVAPTLISMGLLTEIDGDLFASFCLLQGRVRENPMAVKSADLGEIRALSREFGLDPASRSALWAPGLV
jgi:phage terminase small subunit